MAIKKIFFRLFIIGVFLIIIAISIILARGYKINIEQKTLNASAILIANSNPDGAKIYIDGKLKGATDSNIFVLPDTYIVEIKKDGFTSWRKKITIKGEWVYTINPSLFPLNPSLSPITTLGVVKAVASPTGSKVILFTETDNPEKSGIYQLDNSGRPLAILNPLKLLALKTVFNTDYFPKSAEIVFSPDEKQLLLSFLPASGTKKTYLLDIESLTTDPLDVTLSLDTIKNGWTVEKNKIHNKIIETYKKSFSRVAEKYFSIIAFSPDDKKILYTVKKQVYLPIILKPRLIATNQTPEVRNLEPDGLYVYDKAEDKNYKLDIQNDGNQEINSFLMWYSDSDHLVVRNKAKIVIMDYDGTQARTIYAGPFNKEFLTVSSDGKLLILANLNSENNKLPDVYAVGIR